MSGYKRTWLFLFVFSDIHDSTASDFIRDTTINGVLYYSDISEYQREPANSSTYQMSMYQATSAINLTLQSGYYRDFFGIDAGYYQAQKISDRKNTIDEVGMNNAQTVWDETWEGNRSGGSLYKAHAKFKYHSYWLNAGYIAPSGKTLVSSNWNISPGTYRGIESGANWNIFTHDKLSLAYFISDQYKAPWYTRFYSFRAMDRVTPISHIFSIGGSYQHDHWLAEAAYGQSKNYLEQYMWKLTYSPYTDKNTFKINYQIYIANDKSTDNIYDGAAWLQGLSLSYQALPFDILIEATQVNAPGNQGYFTTRLTPTYASSAGRMDFWWDSISDFNADGEKALFVEMKYSLSTLNLPNWSLGTSYAVGWGARPSTNLNYDQERRIHESAVGFYIKYELPDNQLFKGGNIKLRYVKYANHSGITSYSNGFNNTPQDQNNVKLTITLPFSLKN
ncbi:OprD family outer membrane porin [Musicola paradisiaca]|uniref:Outer membrane porin n=1 Tax=Musicola paradisiaca (strain Ech703) TaxID=579405 RepID=C6CDS6_MUSP7|nr:OprD family outer membrane porin [Musicola paradisiaca]ACS85193.1 outer membrane porin [Musicola paradisiaca Ech703]